MNKPEHVWNGKPEDLGHGLSSQRCVNCNELALYVDRRCTGRQTASELFGNILAPEEITHDGN